MKVLHMNTLQHGGAAQCVARICEAIRKQGAECRLLVAEEPESENTYVAEKDKDFWYSNFLLGKIKHLLMRVNCLCDAEKFDDTLKTMKKQYDTPLSISHPLSHYHNIVHHPLIEWADIIHLHWVSGFVDYPSFFKNIHKPIVWTLHDMYPLSGIMHYESENISLPPELKNFDKKCKTIKCNSLKKIKKLNTIAISEVMLRHIQKSELMSEYPCTMIHNGVDTSIFRYQEDMRNPSDKSNKIYYYLKQWGEYNINKDTIIFMFSAYNIWEERKGLANIIKALERCSHSNICLIAAGKNMTGERRKATFPIIYTDGISDQQKLAKLYSLANYYISASFDESFSQTILEAMACGCPVIATPTGIAPEVIKEFNGVLTKGYSYQEITQGIDKALQTKYNQEQIRDYIVQEYDYAKIASQYLELYQKVAEL